MLHYFQKKATKDVSTPKREMELTRDRLALAEADSAKDKRFADRRIIESSGNVFADLGLPTAEEELLKARLIWQINDTIGAHRLRQADAAKLLGLKQPDVSSLLHGKTNGFSVDRLLRLLNRLGKDVKITVKTKPRSRPARITVEPA